MWFEGLCDFLMEVICVILDLCDHVLFMFLGHRSWTEKSIHIISCAG